MFWMVPRIIGGLFEILPSIVVLGLMAVGVMLLIRRTAIWAPRFTGVRSTITNWESDQRQRSPLDESPQSAAVRHALNRAGNFDNDLAVELLDIGLLVYEDDSHPKIFRLGEVPSHASHVRPFLVVEPRSIDDSEHAVIRFNLLDGNDQLRYTSRSRYRLNNQPNFVTPPTWLPLKDETPDGEWSLQVNIGDGPPIAIHDFRWFEVGGVQRAQFDGDGELDERSRRLMQHATKGLALDDLLAVQEQEAPVKVGAGRLG